jgi:hypothetical protein
MSLVWIFDCLYQMSTELKQMVSMPERGKPKHTCAAGLLLQDVGTQSSVSISNGPFVERARKGMWKVKVGLDWGRTWCSNRIKIYKYTPRHLGGRSYTFKFKVMQQSFHRVALTDLFLRLRPGGLRGLKCHKGPGTTGS